MGEGLVLGVVSLFLSILGMGLPILSVFGGILGLYTAIKYGGGARILAIIATVLAFLTLLVVGALLAIILG